MFVGIKIYIFKLKVGVYNSVTRGGRNERRENKRVERSLLVALLVPPQGSLSRSRALQLWPQALQNAQPGEPTATAGARHPSQVRATTAHSQRLPSLPRCSQLQLRL